MLEFNWKLDDLGPMFKKWRLIDFVEVMASLELTINTRLNVWIKLLLCLIWVYMQDYVYR